MCHPLYCTFHAPWIIFVGIYERFLILKIFELDFVNFDSDNDKNPRKNNQVNTGIISSQDLRTTRRSTLFENIRFYLGWIP